MKLTPYGSTYPSGSQWAGWLKATRAELGLTQAKVATLIEHDVRSIKKWESGKEFPKMATRAGIVAILNSQIKP